MSVDLSDIVTSFCLSVILGSYKRLAPRGKLLATREARSERDTLMLAWAMSKEVHEVVLGALGRVRGAVKSQTSEATLHYGQVAGSIDARETLLQQHLSTDPSLFVVQEVFPSKESLMRRQVVAWVLKIAQKEIHKAMQSDSPYEKRLLENHLFMLEAALATPDLKTALFGRLGQLQPGDAAKGVARRSKVVLHPKAANALRIYEGLRHLKPFALRQIICGVLFDHIGDQRRLELAGGLALAEALSITSGHPLRWNFGIVSDGVMANVGPFSVGWHKPFNFETSDAQFMVSANHSRTGSNFIFLRCVDSKIPSNENETIRLATESIVAVCRNEKSWHPQFEETPLSNCAVVMRRLFNFVPATHSVDQMTITAFNEMTGVQLLDLSRRACGRVNFD